MNWTHESVYTALVARGLEHPTERNNYVWLYPQTPNCAIIHNPKGLDAKRRPLHLHPGKKSWQPEVYFKILPAIGSVQLESKSKDQSNQNWLLCEVDDWGVIADALGLE